MKRHLHRTLAALLAVCMLVTLTFASCAEEIPEVTPAQDAAPELETREPAPEDADPVPEAQEPAPEDADPVPEAQEPAPEDAASGAVENAVPELNVELGQAPDEAPDGELSESPELPPDDPEDGSAPETDPSLDPAFLEAIENGVVICAIDKAHFPDANFRLYVLDKCDYNKDGQLTDVEINIVTKIGCSYYDIESLAGIETFSALKELDCHRNLLHSLDLSRNTALKKLSCSNNQLAELNVHPLTALEYLDCSDNLLTTLNLEANGVLGDLSCYSNHIQKLDIRNCPKLVQLYWEGVTPDTSYMNYGGGLYVDPDVELVVGESSASPIVVPIDESHFPDGSFRDYVLSFCDLDRDENLSQLEIDAVKNIECHNRNIGSLQGLEYFPSLLTLECSTNELTALDISHNPALTHLYCATNHLANLDVSKNTALEVLDCDHNPLKTLNIDKNTALRSLYCSDNQLEELDISKNTALRRLSCTDNQLKKLDISKNIALRTLSCTGNQLKELDIRPCPKLLANYLKGYSPLEADGDVLIIYSDATPATICAIDETNFPDKAFRSYVSEEFDRNADDKLDALEIDNITSVYVSNNDISSLKGIEYFTALTDLFCESNQLTSLNVDKNTALTYLSCGNNQLTSLVVSKNTALTYLSCGNNQLASLDVTPLPALDELNCENNQLPRLDVSHNPALTHLYCSGNPLSTLDITNCKSLCYCHHPRFKEENDDGTLHYSYGDSSFTVNASVTVVDGATSDIICPIDAAHFPDIHFRNLVLARVDLDEDEKLSAFESLLTELICSDMDIASLKGIEYFTALKVLDCTDNQLQELDISKNTELDNLNCDYNQLQKLDISKNTALVYLDCDYNQLKALDLSHNSDLEHLSCDHNQIAELNIGNCPNLVKAYEDGDVDEWDGRLEYDWGDAYFLEIDKTTRITTTKPPEPAPAASFYIERDGSGPLDIKKTAQLNAVTTDAGISLKGIKWTTSNKKVATVTAKGKVTAKSAGTATITVTTKDKQHSATIDITVRDMSAPTSITLTSPKPVIDLKEKLTLNCAMTAEGTPKTKLKWATSNKKVATVSAKGVVVGKSAGHVTITVTTANGLHDSVEIEVKDVTSPTSVNIAARDATTLAPKDKVQLDAKMTSESGTVKTKLKWTTSNKSVATVSAKGLVTGKKPGTATITVTTKNGLKDSINITVQ